MVEFVAFIDREVQEIVDNDPRENGLFAQVLEGEDYEVDDELIEGW